MARAKGSLDLFEKIPSEQYDSEVSLQGYEIPSYPADFTLEVLVDKWKKLEINIPPLQRRFIWSQVRASKLIESFLMGLPVPPVFSIKSVAQTNSWLLTVSSDCVPSYIFSRAHLGNVIAKKGRFLSI